MPVVRAAFTGASVLWTLLLALAPYLATRPHASAPGAVLVFAIYSAGHLVCHQLPERSFHLWAAQLPVCARCTGIYLGAALVSIVVGSRGVRFAGARGFQPNDRGARLTARARRALVAAALPTAATLLYEWIMGHAPGNLVRAAAGLPLGIVVAWLVLAATSTGSAAENQVN